MSKKCEVKDRHVTPCTTLNDSSEGVKSGGRARGIYVWPLVNLDTHKPTRTMFGAVTSEHPKGLIFNFCPWCGVDLRASHGSNDQGGVAA